MNASFDETMFTSVRQAMACGLPVLASDIPGINDIVEEERNAILFENDNIDKLIKCVLQLQKNITYRKQMGESSSRYAENHFSALKTFSRYSEMIFHN